MNINYERCARCNRRKLLATGCLRKWLRPMECKHLPRTIDNKRDYSETDVVSVFLTERKPPGSTNKFIKFCKNKLLISNSVISLHRYFTNKVAGSELLPMNKSNDPSTSAEKRIINESIGELGRDETNKKTNIKCLHRDGHLILRGHEKHSCVESCAIYCQLSKHGWYWGGLTSNEAEDLLAGQHDNVFLVRDSFSTRHLLCVSFRCVGRTLHARLRHANGLFSLNNETFVPANKILEHCASVDVATHRFERPVRLARPLNRFAKLDSLQMICRFVIRQKVGNGNYQMLPLPRNLIDYVSLGSDYISPYS